MSTIALDPSLLPNLLCGCPDGPTAEMAGWFFNHMKAASAEGKRRGLCDKTLLRMMVRFVHFYAETGDAEDRAMIAGEMLTTASRIIGDHGAEMLPYLAAETAEEPAPAEPPACGVPNPKSPWAI